MNQHPHIFECMTCKVTQLGLNQESFKKLIDEGGINFFVNHCLLCKSETIFDYLGTDVEDISESDFFTLEVSEYEK